MSWENEKRIRSSMNRFLIVFLVTGILLAALAGLFFRSESDAFLRSIQDQERYVLGLQQQVISNVFETVLGDLFMLTEQTELLEMLDTGSEEAEAELIEEFRSLSRQTKVYDRIRFLDETGRERIRVDFNSGLPVAVPESQLQDKSSRYYFQDIMLLDKGEVYVSPLDLNIDLGRLERPFKPVIRFGTPVFDSRGGKRGVALINYLAQVMLDAVQDIGLAARGHSMLLNHDGYWLLSETPEDQWGFMIEERRDRCFASLYPDEWAMMLEQGQGRIRTGTGMFTFVKILPLIEGRLSGPNPSVPFSFNKEILTAEEYFWILALFIPDEELRVYTRGRTSVVFTAAGLFLAVSVLAWLAALSLTGRRVYRAQLQSMAHFDGLTGLPNRLLFNDRLHLVHEAALRHDRKYGILRLDLRAPDAGGDAGNNGVDRDILVSVAESLQGSLRRADTVARIGEHSLAVLLGELAGPDAARLVAERLVAALCTPRCLGSGEDSVKVFVGLAAYPDHAGDPDELLLLAEQALGVARSRGRNFGVVSSG